MITEVSVPSYFGSDVLIKSENLSYDIFKSNWIPATERYKRNMQILIERTRRPITIFAARVFMLNLITLLKVSWRDCESLKLMSSRCLIELFIPDIEDSLFVVCFTKKFTELACVSLWNKRLNEAAVWEWSFVSI